MQDLNNSNMRISRHTRATKLLPTRASWWMWLVQVEDMGSLVELAGRALNSSGRIVYLGADSYGLLGVIGACACPALSCLAMPYPAMPACLHACLKARLLNVPSGFMCLREFALAYQTHPSVRPPLARRLKTCRGSSFAGWTRFPADLATLFPRLRAPGVLLWRTPW